MKAELSDYHQATLDIPELDIELTVSRQDFEVWITDVLERFQTAISDLLGKAGLIPSDIQLVIRTGGSSLIPAIKQILEAQFPARVIEHDPFTSVAAGLAIAEFKGLGMEPSAQ